MDFIIEPVRFPWEVFLVSLVAAIVFGGLFVSSCFRELGWLAGLSMAGTVLAVAATPVVPTTLVQDELVEKKVSGLESVGFEDVNLTGSRFIASLDGQYYRGLIEEVGTDHYAVFEITN